MHILLAADTYQHHPRNILGFKKKGAKPYTRLVTTTAIDSRTGNEIHKTAHRARLKDDPSWNECRPDWGREGFSNPSRWAVDDLMSELALSTEEEILYSGLAYEGLREACYRLYGESPGSYIGKTFVDIDYYLPLFMRNFAAHDLAMLSAEDIFASAISIPENGMYTPFQLQELLQSHHIYNDIHKYDDSLCAARKMLRNYKLATEGIGEEIKKYAKIQNIYPS
jgi:hypothetical protein